MQLDQRLENALNLLEAMVRGNASAMRLQLPPVLRTMVALMPSPLGSPRTTKAFLMLKQAAFEEEQMAYGEMVIMLLGLI